MCVIFSHFYNIRNNNLGNKNNPLLGKRKFFSRKGWGEL